MRCSILFLGFVFVAFSCNDGTKTTSRESTVHYTTKYAVGFDLKPTDSSIIAIVYDPLGGHNGKQIQYKLCKEPFAACDEYCIHVPIKKAVCMSSTHIGFIGALNADSVIAAISGAKYVNNPRIWERVVRGEIAEVGYEQSLNYELISRLNPDLVFAYGIGTESLSYIEKLKELGIRVALVPDYLENTPLGRAEWIKFFGAFLGKEELANSIFSDVENSYKMLCRQLVGLESKPKVFLNLPFRDVWYFPGAENYFVHLINDAGGNYVFPELTGSNSHPVSTEIAYKAGVESDFWLNPGTANSLSEIADIDNRFANFKAFRNGGVFNNNRRMGKGGGNDFWELGVVRPDFILSDLIKIFHPTLPLTDSLYFYKKLEP